MWQISMSDSNRQIPFGRALRLAYSVFRENWSPSDWLEEDPGVSAWRVRIFHSLMLTVVVLGIITYIPSVWMSIASDVLSIAVIDTIVLVWALGIFMAFRASFRTRVVHLLLANYVLALFLLVQIGPVSQIYLFMLSIIASLLLGLRAGIAAIALNALTLATIGYLANAEFNVGNAMMDNSLAKWLVISVNFVFANAVCALSVSVLVRGLEDTLLKERKARLDLANEHAVVRDAKARIEHEMEERARAETERMRLATAIEQASEVILIADTQGQVLYVNSACERILGHTREEILALNVRELIYANDETAAPPLGDAMGAGVGWRGYIRARRKDGDPFEAHVMASPIRDEHGVLINFVVVLRDVTQERDLEARLRQVQKLEAIGTFAGGIAHDFNNILAAILGYAELLDDELGADEKHRGDVEQIIHASMRARDLVRQILVFSKQTESVRRTIDVKAVCEETVSFLRASIPSTIDIVRRMDSSPCQISADPVEIKQVIMNLCANAAHAMHDRGGTLEISVRPVRLTDDMVIRLPRLNPRQAYVSLSVRDTGHGMKRDVLERIFEPFFTTKERSRGTGLGLATVHGIVTSLGGDITVYSEPGQGSIFRVYFPNAEEGAVTETNERKPAPRGNGERILLVDDEDTILGFAKQFLERLGYAVEACNRSRDALNRFTESPASFDLVITDQTMPGITGVQLAAALREIRADLPIILSSGFSDVISPETIHRHSIQDFVQKPFNQGEMAAAIRRVLDDSRVTGLK
jgi:two-component system cell cycle sensor histidine kinase/response regulator CckA